MFQFIKKIFGHKDEQGSEETVQINTAKPVQAMEKDGISALKDIDVKENDIPSDADKPAVKITPCKTCGKPIKYNPVRKRIPNYCADCKKNYKEAQKTKQGMVTYTCKNCGKTETLPETVQHWPDLCQECRAKLSPQKITRKCKGCGKTFTFPSNVKHWPNYCRSCQSKRKRA